MKFVVSSSALLGKLNAIKGLVPSSPVIPILENFLFQINDNNTLSVTASDLQTSMSTQVEVDADGKGSVAVPAKMLVETLRNLPEQPVTFEIDAENFVVSIKSDNGQYKLAGEDPADFPQTPEVKGMNEVSLTADTLANALAYTLFAVSHDDMKPAMNGVYVNLTEDNITFVATDSHRLVRYRRDDVKSTSSTAIIIPGKALEQLKNALPSENIDVKVEFNDANAIFSFNHIRMTCRLIDERFPDYENVIPINNDKKLTIERSNILSSLKRIVIYANKTTNQVRLKLNERELTVSAEDLDFSNEASEALYCEFEGEEMEIGFNAKFLQEMLTNIHSEKVDFQLSQPNRAALLMPADQEASEEVLMLVMPIMLNNYL